MNCLLVGAGRMGLTHLALFNLLAPNSLRWTVVEPSLSMRLGLRRSLPAPNLQQCVRSLEALPAGKRFDFAVICSPTPFHAPNYRMIRERCDKVFVEKPLAINAPDPTTLCGYVLVHHPLQRELVNWATTSTLERVDVELRSNTVLGPNDGWRGDKSQGGGVINEFGSHTLSLLVDLVGGIDTCSVLEQESIHSPNAADRAILKGKGSAGCEFTVSLNWSDPDSRKPQYTVRAKTAEGAAWHDFYEITINGERSSIADRDSSVGVYLRGLEFTAQARYFLENAEFSSDIALATEVDRVLAELAC